MAKFHRGIKGDALIFNAQVNYELQYHLYQITLDVWQSKFDRIFEMEEIAGVGVKYVQFWMQSRILST